MPKDTTYNPQQGCPVAQQKGRFGGAGAGVDAKAELGAGLKGHACSLPLPALLVPLPALQAPANLCKLGGLIQGGLGKGVWAVASATPVQPSTGTRDDHEMLACPVAILSSR